MPISTSTRLGYFFILLVAIDWILSSYLVQDLENENVPPYIITTVCNSLFLLCLVVHWADKWRVLPPPQCPAGASDAPCSTCLSRAGPRQVSATLTAAAAQHKSRPQ